MSKLEFISEERENDGRKVYNFRRGAVGYVAYAPRRTLPWEVCLLAKTKHGRAWRWFSDLNKGVAAEVLAAAQELHNFKAASIARAATKVDAQAIETKRAAIVRQAVQHARECRAKARNFDSINPKGLAQQWRDAARIEMERARRNKPRAWVRDAQTNEHFLTVSEELALKVYRTAAGDHAITCHSESAGHGGECEYMPDLRRAKDYAEAMAADGTYTRLTPQP
jgi:hypothetical protein